MNRKVTLFAVGYALIVIAIVVAAGTGGTNQTFSFITRYPYGDKIGHFGLMGMLALVADLALRMRNVRVGALHVPLAPAVVALLVTLEELSQRWLPGKRTFDLLDLAADAGGIVVFVLAGRLLLRRPTRRA